MRRGTWLFPFNRLVIKPGSLFYALTFTLYPLTL